jgi:signal transduction histidine kinase
MANSTKAAMPSYALAAIVVNRAQSSEACNGIEAFLAKVQRISATGGFFRRAATAEVTVSEQVYHIFDFDPALPLTLELMASRVHPDDLPLFHERIEQARIAVSDGTEFAIDLPRVRGDRVQLQQVVINLLANSSEAMSDVEDHPRHLLIKTERHDGAQVCVTVRDAGMGFHPKDAERLFEPLYTTKSNGMGIGLFISRTIIERHGGSLWAASNDGWGATFSFSIPVEP